MDKDDINFKTNYLNNSSHKTGIDTSNIINFKEFKQKHNKENHSLTIQIAGNIPLSEFNFTIVVEDE